MQRTSLLLLPSLLLASYVHAESTDVLQYDSQPPLPSGTHFHQDDPKRIVRHDFSVKEYALMSNDRGERWALVTFVNEASGQRLLNNDVLVAEFADGTERYAQNLEAKLEGGETLTRTVFFGYHRFPISGLRWQ